MARTKAALGNGARLTDFLSTSLLARVYPGSRTGVAGYPQAQCAILVECATHPIVGANIGAYRDVSVRVIELPRFAKALSSGLNISGGRSNHLNSLQPSAFSAPLR